MYLDGILSTGYTSQATANSIYKDQEEERSSLPRNWGSDTVNFSPEAVAVAQRAEAENKRQAEDTMEEDATSAAFAKYMRQARGEESSSAASPKEELERLKELLKKLTDKKAQVAKEEGPAGQSKMEAQDVEINQVIRQIAELSSQIAAEKGTDK